MIYLLIETADVADIPLVPFFLTLCLFGVMGAMMTLIEVELPYLLVIASVVSIGLFFIVYYAFKSLITKPDDLTKFEGKKAIVEIPIDHNSTGRVKVINAAYAEEFPAKANLKISKNSEVIIEHFLGTIAFVIPIPSGTDRETTNLTYCKKCNATVDRGTHEYCPYCGEKI